MTEPNPGFLQRLLDATASVGRRFRPDTPDGLKELQEYALQLVHNPEAEETRKILDGLKEHQALPEGRILNKGFRPKMDVDFTIAEKDNYFRRGKRYPGKDEPEPAPGHP